MLFNICVYIKYKEDAYGKHYTSSSEWTLKIKIKDDKISDYFIKRKKSGWGIWKYYDKYDDVNTNAISKLRRRLLKELNVKKISISTAKRTDNKYTDYTCRTLHAITIRFDSSDDYKHWLLTKDRKRKLKKLLK